MSAFWGSLIINTQSQIENMKFEKTNMQTELSDLSDQIAQAQENKEAIWNNYENMAYASINANNQVLQDRITQIQNDSSLSESDKNTQVQLILNQMQTAKTRAEAYMNQYKQYQNQMSQMEIKSLKNKEKLYQLRMTHLEQKIENKSKQLQTYQENDKKANESIFGGKSQV